MSANCPHGVEWRECKKSHYSSEGQELDGTDSVSIMPLVEENRKLHDEVKVLKQLLADQNVRVDQWLDGTPLGKRLSRVRVEVDAQRILLSNGRDYVYVEAMREMVKALLTQNLVSLVQEADGRISFEFFTLGAPK